MDFNLRCKIFGLFIVGMVSLNSCSSDGDDKDEVVEITQNDIMYKDWYVNTMYNKGAKYDMQEGLEVYRFMDDDILIMQEYGGRRVFKGGSWTMKDNQLFIEKEGKEQKQWYIVPPSDKEHLYLNDKGAVRQLVSSVGELEGLFADAWIVNEYYNLGQASGYRFGVQLQGDNIKEVTVLFDNGDKYPLVEFKRGVWGFQSSNVVEHSESFGGTTYVQFYVRFKSGYVTKLSDKIYENCLHKLDYQSVVATHGVNSRMVDVKWEPLDDSRVYYRVEILKNIEGENEANENSPVFISRAQSPGSDGLMVQPGIDSVLDNLDELNVGDPFYVKVIAYAYEPDLDLDNFRYEDVNIQTTTQFIYPMGAW